MSKTPGLDDAYAMSSKDDVTKLYKSWATSYDVGFGAAQGHRLPELVAQAFAGAGGKGPVLDVGAGTGLVGEHLKTFDIAPIDALDLSEDMLDVARAKAIYRGLIVADVTEEMTRVMAPYNGIISAGTFTHGHVGMEGIHPLLKVAAQDAVFALSINATHYAAKGFAAGFDAIADQITEFKTRELRIYDDRASEEHRDDLAKIVTFKKA